MGCEYREEEEEEEAGLSSGEEWRAAAEEENDDDKEAKREVEKKEEEGGGKSPPGGGMGGRSCEWDDRVYMYVDTSRFSEPLLLFALSSLAPSLPTYLPTILIPFLVSHRF